MPVNYGSQIDEHHAVRTRRRHVRRLAHARRRSRGRRRARLPALRARQQRRQAEGRRARRCIRACCKPDGGVIDDLIVYFLREDFFRLVVNAGTADKDIAWFRALIAEHAPALTLTPRADLAMIAVQGPNARAKALAGAARRREAASPTLKPFMRRVVRRRVRRRHSSRAPATPARTASRSCCPATRRRRRCGTRSRGRRARPAGSARATRCGSRPA